MGDRAYALSYVMSPLLGLDGGEEGLADFGMKDEIQGLDGMEVETGKVVVALGQQPLGIVARLTAVEAGERGDVELELDVLLLKSVSSIVVLKNIILNNMT